MHLRCLIIILCCIKISAGSIVNITRENFEELIEKSADTWLLNFCSYHNKECQNIMSEFLKSSKILDRYIKLGFVDVENEVILTYTFGAANIPRILLFGYDKMHPKDFEGFKTVRGFTKAAMKMVENDINEQIKNRFVNTRLVHELDEYSLNKLLSSNKDDKNWCVVSYSSSCQDCQKFSDIFKRLSEYFQHSFNFGSIDVLKHSHHLEKYPQIRHYISERSIQNYSEELTFDGIKLWLLQLLSNPQVKQLTNPKVLEKNCKNKKYCVLISMPTLDKFNETHRTNLIEDLNQRALNTKQLSLGWLWFENGDQIHLERLLNLTETLADNSFPVYTVVHVKKLIYLQLRQYNKDGCDILDKMLGHVTDETDFNGIIETTEFPKIFKVPTWKYQQEIDIGNVKTEL